MIINKLVELDALLNAGDVNHLRYVEASFIDVQSAGSSLIVGIERIYDPKTGTWTQWCEDNLDAEDKDKLISIYNILKPIKGM